MKLFITGLLSGIALISLLALVQTEETEVAAEVESRVEQKIYNPPLPPAITFAGETVPLEDPEVRERFEREMMVNTYWHSSSLQLFKLSNRYFPTIEKILAEEGIPDDFKYLAVAESGLRNVTSPANAKGMWQIMKGTARENGLEVSGEVDERYHMEKATRAASGYLRKAREKFGSWSMAAAAYNMGIPGLQRQANNQKTEEYYNLFLNQETSRYVFRILAMKQLFANPEQYGFYLEEKDLYNPMEYKVVEVDSALNSLADFAQSQGCNYKELKILNPWLRQPYLKNTSAKTYQIRIPI